MTNDTLAAPVLRDKADFADWLSPMLVKELRQGVRTRVFVTIFILLQFLMLMNISFSLLVAANSRDTSEATVFFWVLVAVPVLMVLPAGGLNAISGEIKANTLELIFLTRLTAFRIVVGKWLAIFAQSLLLVCAVLPYLVLRYFIGGVNISTELITLGLMLASSALLCAVATGLSAYPTRVVRVLAVFFSLGAFTLLSALFSFVSRRSPLSHSATDFRTDIGLGICCVIVLLLMLRIGAARIAPPAENHSAPLRLLALAALLVACAACWFIDKPILILGVTFVIIYSVCAIAVCEEPRWIPSLFRPNASRGWAGRTVGRFLYPGWPAGVLLAVVLLSAFALLLSRNHLLNSSAEIVVMTALAGTLLLPVALIRGFFPKTTKATILFFSVQIACAGATFFCLMCDGILKTHFKEFITFLPLSALIMTLGDAIDAAPFHRIVLPGITTGVSLVVLLVAVWRSFRQVRLMEGESLRLPAPLAKTDATLA